MFKYILLLFCSSVLVLCQDSLTFHGLFASNSNSTVSNQLIGKQASQNQFQTNEYLSDMTSLSQKTYVEIAKVLKTYQVWKDSDLPTNYFNISGGHLRLEIGTKADMLNMSLFLYGEPDIINYPHIRIDIIGFSSNFTVFQENKTLVGPNFEVSTTESIDNKTSTCKTNLWITFLNASNEKQITDLNLLGSNDTEASFELKSNSCSLILSRITLARSHIEPSNLTASNPIYIAMIISYLLISAIVLRYTLRKPLYRASGTPKLSVWSIVLINACDIYLIVIHLHSLKLQPNWIPSMVFFALSLLVGVESSLVLMVFINSQSRSNNITLCCSFLGLYYIMLAATACLMIFIQSSWKFAISSLFLLPQIIMTAQHGKTYIFLGWYEVGYSVSQSILVAYTMLYSKSIFEYDFHPEIGGVFLGLIILQLIILKIQVRYPRLFWSGKPHRYTFTMEICDDEPEACPICMKTLNGEKKKLLENLIPNKEKKIYRTPCQHKYHAKCLKGWMHEKFECPMCRQRIPSIVLSNEGREEQL